MFVYKLFENYGYDLIKNQQTNKMAFMIKFPKNYFVNSA